MWGKCAFVVLTLAVLSSCASPHPATRPAAAPPSPVPIATLMPNRALTPGKADTVSLAIICGTTTKSRRHVTEATKARVFAEYHITTRTGYEVDHLVPLAIGGSNDILNLWPEPAVPVPGFHEKDVLEVRLHTLVCSGKLDVAKAQAQVATDWPDAYFQYVKP